jgi:phosphatidylglycerophosphatase A
MKLINGLIRLCAFAFFVVVSIATFIFSSVVAVFVIMAAIGAGIIALVTFGVIDYRKHKKSKELDEYGKQ